MKLRHCLLTLFLALKGFTMTSLAITISLDHKIGQMIVIGFDGVQAQDSGVKQTLAYANKGLIGGVIFFGYNIKSPEQVKKLTKTIKTSKGRIPLLVAVDQEGGKVQRLKSVNGFKDFLSAHEVAAQFTADDAEKYYALMAEQSYKAGFNVVFGPIVDLHADADGCVNPVIGAINRSFSSDPAQVVDYAQAFIKAHHRYKILTSLKHFPGHGYATNDSHKGMTDITETHADDELQPFIQLINACQADMIMAAHLMHRSWDDRYPTSLSHKALNELLRQKMHYDGVIISDDLHMGAIGQHYTLEETVVQTIKAGCDILMFSNNKAAAQGVDNFDASVTIVERIHDIIKQALRDGRLTTAQIDKSYGRIVAMKSKL